MILLKKKSCISLKKIFFLAMLTSYSCDMPPQNEFLCIRAHFPLTANIGQSGVKVSFEILFVLEINTYSVRIYMVLAMMDLKILKF